MHIISEVNGLDHLYIYSPLLFVFLAATFNWLMTFLGATLICFVKTESKKLVSIALGSSAGIMIAASFFSLLLPAKERLEGLNTFYLLIIPIGFLCGVLFLKVTDFFFPHEHALIHEQEEKYLKNKVLMFAMTLHNIPEGLAVGVAFAGVVNNNYLPALILSIGIGIQNFPEGTAVALPMHQCGRSKKSSIMYGQFSGLVEIPSAILGFLFASFLDGLLPFALSFAAGAMVFVCVQELIPEASNASKKDLGSFAFVIGFIVMMSLDILLS